jgi:hypothetical protein
MLAAHSALNGDWPALAIQKGNEEGGVSVAGAVETGQLNPAHFGVNSRLALHY